MSILTHYSNGHTIPTVIVKMQCSITLLGRKVPAFSEIADGLHRTPSLSFGEANDKIFYV